MSTGYRTKAEPVESPASYPSASDTPIAVRPIPPLRNGDHLTAAEFHRRYDAMPELKKAELIDGVVYIPASRDPYRKHGVPHFDLTGWMGFYSGHTIGTVAANNCTIKLDLDCEPQPDACLLIEPEFGGQVWISADDYIVGAPDLVAEVAYSSVSIDLHKKFEMYRRHAVREYLVWRTEDSSIDWFVNREGRFERIAADAGGLLRSEAFPGLWLDPQALLNGDLASVFAAVQRGIASPEHAAFVERLRVGAARIAEAPPADREGGQP